MQKLINSFIFTNDLGFDGLDKSQRGLISISKEAYPYILILSKILKHHGIFEIHLIPYIMSFCFWADYHLNRAHTIDLDNKYEYCWSCRTLRFTFETCDKCDIHECNFCSYNTNLYDFTYYTFPSFFKCSKCKRYLCNKCYRDSWLRIPTDDLYPPKCLDCLNDHLKEKLMSNHGKVINIQTHKKYGI